MSDPIRPAPQGDAARGADDRPDFDHPQAQAAQWPGGGGAPETGSEDNPAEKTMIAEQEAG